MAAATLQKYPSWVPRQVDFPTTGDLASSMLESCRRFAGKPAFICGAEQLSYLQLASLSERLAAYLLNECGLVAGDRVAVMMPNLIAYPPTILAILRAGLVVVNLNPLYAERELQNQLVDSGSKAIIIANPLVEVLDQVITDTEIETVLIAPMDEPLAPVEAVLDTVRLPLNAVLSYTGKMPEVEISPLSGAFLQYTGGTTGPSKGATLSHGNLLANQEQFRTWIDPVMHTLPASQNHVVITALPLYHVFALAINYIGMVRYGATNVLISNPRDVANLVDTWKGLKITVFTAVNTLFNSLLHTPGFDELDFSALRLTIGGGAAVQDSVASQWKQLTGRTITEGYGLSETSPVLTMNSVATDEHNNTVGFALPSTEIILLTDNGKQVDTGEAGELCVRGPQVMSGYWGQPDLNAEVFTDDGFFRTGDMAIKHSNGSYKIIDRKKDLILVSGFSVYPTEIEAVSASHPKVLEAACVGVPDDKTGETVKVYVVRSDESLDAETLISYFREKLTAYKVPRYVEFINVLPKNPVGKILRRKLRAT